MKTHHHPNRALSQKEMEARRLQAAPYFKKQWSERVIGRMCGVSSVAIHQWKVAWKAKGLNGLRAGYYGPPSKLPPHKEKTVRKKILEGAEIHGFSGDFWTLNRITEAVKSWTGVLYQDRSVWHLLRRLGFSCQKPLKRAVERDEEAIRTWKQKTWLLIKKGGSEMA